MRPPLRRPTERSRPSEEPIARTVVRVVALALALTVTGTGCSVLSPTDPDPSPSSAEASAPATDNPSTASSQPAPAPPRATPAPVPAVGSCYRLSFEQALAPTSGARPRDCATTHTARTTFVGRLDTVVAGHLLAVDSEALQAQVATDCPGRVTSFLGGRPNTLRLTMLRPVWFTPTLEQSDEGADWYRCDVTAVAQDGELAPLIGRLAGILARPRDLTRYAMCGTAEPGTADFQRVVCSRRHTWRAIEVVDLGDGDYPGSPRARAAGQQPCDDAARQLAADTLDYEWGYEWPTAEQWAAGQTYGLCWHPDPGPAPGAGNGAGSGG